MYADAEAAAPLSEGQGQTTSNLRDAVRAFFLYLDMTQISTNFY